MREKPYGGTRWQPQLDIADTGEELHVALDAPGMSPENFEITIEDNTLQIAGTRTLQPHPPGGTHTLLCERPCGAFQRTIPLPYPVETQKIEATYKEGILNVRLPKTAEAQAKRIAIKT
jgi:HSP20 family protein